MVSPNRLLIGSRRLNCNQSGATVNADLKKVLVGQGLGATDDRRDIVSSVAERDFPRFGLNLRVSTWKIAAQKGSTDKTFEPKKTAADTSSSLEFIFGRIMPLLRYFTFAGGALFALLMVVSSYFPATET